MEVPYRHRRRGAVRPASARVHLPGVGDARRVVARRPTAAGVFVPVKDAARRHAAPTAAVATSSTRSRAPTSGATSATAVLVIDLNFAYNPSCAYSPEWTCPLAPATNTVGVALPVGELMDVKLSPVDHGEGVINSRI